MKKIIYIHVWAFLLTLSISIIPNTSYAEKGKNKQTAAEREAEEKAEKERNKVQWEIHKSITNIFEAKFPREYKYKIYPFQFNDDTVAFSAEIVSSLDGKLATKKEKSIFIKATQTFGTELTRKDVKKITNRAESRYLAAAKALNGVVLTNEDLNYKGFIGKDMYISYNLDDVKYGLRIRLFLTNFSKVEQVLSGPGHTMYSYRSDDFFDSISLNDGITTKENPIGAGWIEYPSKNNIFTVTLPPQNSDFTPKLPFFSATPSKGTMFFSIMDPVLEQNVIYNVTSYKGNKKFSYNRVKSLIFSQHISKYVKNASSDNLKTENSTIDGTNIMKVKLIVSPPKSHPHINSIMMEARYVGKTLVIQEFLCGKKHAKSGLDKTLFSQLKFHPEKYKAVEKATKTPEKDAKGAQIKKEKANKEK